MRYTDEDDTLLGLEKARKGRKPRRWSGSLPQRVRASRRLPQAVFKISSYSHSAGAVWDRVTYVARDGELEVEAQDGEALDHARLEALVDTWDARAGEGEHQRARRRAMSAVVSFPAGVDQERATEAARQFFREAFADNHDYVFAPHADTDTFHVHLVLETRGHDERQLRLNRADIQDLRLLLAEKAREQGIELDASPRWARGVGKESQRPRAVEGIERRGGEAAWEPARERSQEAAGRHAAVAALAEEQAKHRAGAAHERPCQALEYARAAAALTAHIPKLETDQRKRAAVQGAVQLAEFGWALSAESQDKAADIAEARAVINRAARAIHSHIRGIETGAEKKQAIEAERRLTGQLQAYRQEQRERAAEERQARAAAQARDAGPERER